MDETRHRFHEALTELEHKTLDGFELVIEQLDRALESVGSRDLELAATVVADDDRVNSRYREIHEDALSLLARQTPVAGDLRLVAALLDIMRCVERMGDQCANIAKLVPLSGLCWPFRPSRRPAPGSGLRTNSTSLVVFELLLRMQRPEEISRKFRLPPWTRLTSADARPMRGRYRACSTGLGRAAGRAVASVP